MADLERQLAAARKTIAALMRRVEGTVGENTSAFAVLEQNIALEHVVNERTAQLVAQNALLQSTFAELKKAQTELLQTQTLESVGRLASGIAHEINNPVQFVSDSVHFLKDAFADLLKLLEGHRAIVALAASGPVEPKALAGLAEVVAEVDLEYLVVAAPRAVDRAISGLDRITRLVGAMKEFAHPSQLVMTQGDLNRALECTLEIARHQTRSVAEVHTQLGALPLVVCCLSELNQVFLNLVINAAHAIEEKRGAGEPLGRIEVRTWTEGDQVLVSISDTGAGIPPAIRGKIFEPFFTTKAVGRGTGQGLAICRNIVVDKHGGQLTFESTAGEGTTFLIRLPVAGKPQPEPTPSLAG